MIWTGPDSPSMETSSRKCSIPSQNPPVFSDRTPEAVLSWTAVNQTTVDSPVNLGVHADTSEPDKIGASTPYDFEARNLTAYGGLLPVATMLEKLGFQQ